MTPFLKRSPSAVTGDVARLVVGLGNPGRGYARSRHNVGFLVADELSRRSSIRFDHRWSDSLVGVGSISGVTVAIAKPQSFMNLSGDPVRALLKRFRLEPDNLVVVSDDLDLPLGRIRLREGGGAGGHRGVQSIIFRLGTPDFPRVRIGIGRPDPADAAEYVLSEFSSDERLAIKAAANRAADAIVAAFVEGFSVSMNLYNQ
jgi:PTH1 family peptidyl-tRNA hydrolase